jgi:hypothetical protein
MAFAGRLPPQGSYPAGLEPRQSQRRFSMVRWVAQDQVTPPPASCLLPPATAKRRRLARLVEGTPEKRVVRRLPRARFASRRRLLLSSR